MAFGGSLPVSLKSQRDFVSTHLAGMWRLRGGGRGGCEYDNSMVEKGSRGKAQVADPYVYVDDRNSDLSLWHSFLSVQKEKSDTGGFSLSLPIQTKSSLAYKLMYAESSVHVTVAVSI